MSATASLSQTTGTVRSFDPKRPAVRGEVDVQRRRADIFLVRDPQTGRQFEVTARERALLSLIDGTRTLNEIVQECHDRLGVDLKSGRLEEFLEQLRSHGLLIEKSQYLPEAAPRGGSTAAGAGAARLNLIFDLIVLVFGFALRPVWLLVAAPLAGLALWALASNFTAYIRDLTILVRSINVPIFFYIIGLKLLFLDVPRGVLKGMMCRRHGGWIRSFRVGLLRGMVPYVSCDTGDSVLTMGEKGRDRMLWVGLRWQVCIASIATLGWQIASRGGLPHDFFLLLSVPGLIGLLFQLNVFIKLDGYALLGVKLEVPRLYERARADAKAWLTFRRAPEALASETRNWFRAYGLATYINNGLLGVVIAGGGLWQLTSRFDGAGALLGTAVVLRWYWEDVRRVLMAHRTINWMIRTGGKWYIRWPVRLALIGALIFAARLPYNYGISGECRVVPAEQYGARAQLGDEIVEVRVREGDLVEAGQVLAVLSGRDTRADVAVTRADLDEAVADHAKLVAGALPEEIETQEHEVQLLEIELAYQEGEVARDRELVESDISSQTELDQQIRLRDAAEQRLYGARSALERLKIGARQEDIDGAAARIERLRSLLAFHEEQLGLIEIRSPISGKVVSPYMEERLGQVAQEGELICIVQGTGLLIEIEADEAAASEVAIGMAAVVRLFGLGGGAPLRGKVVRLGHSTLSGAGADDQAVRSDRELLIQRSAPRGDGSHFRVYVELDAVTDTLVPGMTGHCKITIEEEQLWKSAARPVVRFFRTEVWSWLP